MHTPTLEEVFAARLFVVPDYQRGYAWEARHRQDLIEDIDLLPAGKDHFSGLLVLCRTTEPLVLDKDGRRYSTFHVVDGQQRLTSLVLLLDALAREFEAVGMGTLAQGIRSSYVVGKALRGEPMWRFLPGVDANSWWRDVVVGSGTSTMPAADIAQRRLEEARKQYADHLAQKRKAVPESAWGEWLQTTYLKVTGHLRFAVYEVGDESDVGVIFEVMNDRGKQLSSMEKVKNHLLYLTQKLNVDARGLARDVNQRWGSMFRMLLAAGLSDAEDDVLRVHWLVTHDPDPRRWDNYASVKTRFALPRDGSHAQFLEQLSNYVSTLHDACFAYVEATRPGSPTTFSRWAAKAADVRHWNDKLARQGRMANLRPLLVAARMARPDDADGYLELAQALERYAFRVYAVMERKSHAGKPALLRIAHDVFHRRVGLVDAARRVDALCAKWCDDNDFRTEMSAELDWYQVWWGHLKYFFYEYEESAACSQGVQVTWEQISKKHVSQAIEHILPQTPTDPYWKEHFPDTRERNRLIHDLGNLVLTARDANSAYSNKPFPEKRGALGQKTACYANGLYQEQQLCAHKSWTPTLVRKRHKRLVDWACERWALPAGLTPAESEEAEEFEEAEEVEEVEVEQGDEIVPAT